MCYNYKLDYLQHWWVLMTSKFAQNSVLASDECSLIPRPSPAIVAWSAVKAWERGYDECAGPRDEAMQVPHPLLQQS